MIKPMQRQPEDPESETVFRSVLGIVVLAIAVGCANVTALPLDHESYTARLADATVRRLFAAGYIAQIVTGIWLALSLLLDVRGGTRAALLSWLCALCLFFAPVPTIRAAPLAAAAPLAGVVLTTLVGWALDRSLREQPT